MKKLLFFALFASVSPFSFGQSSTVSGVITYFFNDNYGYRPDVGASVYVFKEKIAPPGVYEYSTLDTFKVVNNWRELGRISKVINQDLLEQEKEALKKYRIETEEDFEDLDKRAFAILSKIKMQTELKTTVDGNGNFSISIPPGDYSILVISSHREGLSITEVMGKFYHGRFKVKAGEKVSFTGNFEL